MKKIKQTLKRSVVILAVVGLAAIQANGANLSTSSSDFFTEYPDQLEFPIIILQPLNQLVSAGSIATFAVKVENEPLTYQWLRNGVVMPGETNSCLTILDVKIEDVGLYSCNISKNLEIVPTRGAQLMVYAPKTSSSLETAKAASQDGGSMFMDSTIFTVYATPVSSSGSSGSCPGSYAGYVNYTKTVAQGWGWAPTSGTTIHTATDITRTDTKVEYKGKSLDSGCNQTTVSVPDPTYSTKYRFTIYFTNNIPTNSYPIELNGFNP